MNIFVTDPAPQNCAKALDDLRCVKMPTESGQMLATNCRLIGISHDTLPNIFNKNHPCTVWARQNNFNYTFLVTLFEELCMEYTLRFGKYNKYEVLALQEIFKAHPLFDKNIYYKLNNLSESRCPNSLDIMVDDDEQLNDTDSNFIYCGDMNCIKQVPKSKLIDKDIFRAYRRFLHSKPNSRWKRASPPKWWGRE